MVGLGSHRPLTQPGNQMKKILLALTILTTAGACSLALNNAARQSWRQFQSNKDIWLTQTQQLAELQVEQAALTVKIRDLKRELRGPGSSLEPTLMDFLLTNDLKSASLQMQNKLLAELGQGENSSGNYLLVSKATLTQTALGPVKAFPNNGKLTDTVCGILAITAEERMFVEAAFAENLASLGAWATASVQREGNKDDLLVQYTIPTDPAFTQAATDRLFSAINAAIGKERTDLLHKYYDYSRISIDGAVADRTNILSIHRISESPGLGYRTGWKWKDSEAINTYPEPLKSNTRFPYAFYSLFPGGWPDVLQREGLAVPDTLIKKP